MYKDYIQRGSTHRFGILCVFTFAAITAAIRLGMDSASFVVNWGVISMHHTNFIASINDFDDERFLGATFSFSMTQKFSIGFKSGLLPGHGPRFVIPCSMSHCFAAFV